MPFIPPESLKKNVDEDWYASNWNDMLDNQSDLNSRLADFDTLIGVGLGDLVSVSNFNANINSPVINLSAIGMEDSLGDVGSSAFMVYKRTDSLYYLFYAISVSATIVADSVLCIVPLEHRPSEDRVAFLSVLDTSSGQRYKTAVRIQESGNVENKEEWATTMRINGLGFTRLW